MKFISGDASGELLEFDRVRRRQSATNEVVT